MGWLHIAVAGTVPSGGDGGNWLALAAESVGRGVMSAEVTYPPLFPWLLAAADFIVGDRTLALTTAALVAKGILVLGTFLCTRALGRFRAVAAAVVVGTGGAILEAYAWGGYTQLLAMGLGFLATHLIIEYLAKHSTTNLLFGLPLCGATLLTHTMVGGLLGVALLVAVFHHLFLAGAMKETRRRNLMTGVGIAVSVIAVSVAAFIGSASAGYEPTVNPSGVNRLEALVSSVRDAPYPWLIIAILGVGALVFRYWPEPMVPTVAVGSGWAVTSMSLFLVTGEPRALLVTQVGLVLLALVGFGAFHDFFRQASAHRHARGTSAALWRRLLTIFAISMVTAVVAGGIGRYRAATDWYRVVGPHEIEALDELAEQSAPANLVLAATGHHGNPVGWWVQGYAERPAYTGMDPAFLAFPEEIEQAEIANEFFSGELATGESLAVLEETGADFVVVDRRGPDADWLNDTVAQELTVVDDSSNLVILRVES